VIAKFGLFVPNPSGDLAARAAVHLTWQASSVDVRWRPPLSVAIVTYFVTQSVASRSAPDAGDSSRPRRHRGSMARCVLSFNHRGTTFPVDRAPPGVGGAVHRERPGRGAYRAATEYLVILALRSSVIGRVGGFGAIGRLG